MIDNPQGKERILGGYKSRMLALTSLATMFGNGAQLIIPPLLPEIIGDLAISSSLAGIGLSVMWASTALFHYPGGHLSDNYSRKSLFVPSLVIILLGLSSLVLFTYRITFFIGIVVLGIGAGLYTPVAFAQISDLYIERRGLAFGINTASLNLGGFFGAILAVVSLQFFSWRDAFIPIIGALILISVLYHYQSNETYNITYPEFKFKNTLSRLMSDKTIYYNLMLATTYGFVWQGVLSFYPTFLNTSKSINTTTSGLIFGGIFIIGFVSTPIAGRISDFLGHNFVALLSVTITLIGLILVLVTEQFSIILCGTAVLAIGLSSFWPAINAELMNNYPINNKGGDYGATRTIFIASESVGPLFMGIMGNHFSYLLGFYTLAVILLGTIGIFLLRHIIVQ